ncbi:MAG: type II toxin-antitoxin system VapC family toxin [Elusimicrobia bacterium]|nr:type II toxin-antitoxin system VapC family toxin [Elusimicrobiota bacterium]
MARKIRFYLDTSVPNHLFATDTPERMAATERFFSLLKDHARPCEAFISEMVVGEIARAPEPRRQALLEALRGFPVLDATAESIRLARDYTQAGIIPPRYEADAIHLAVAAAHGLDMVISWNFEHMVNTRTRRQVNAINDLKGFPRIEIVTPEEVNWDDFS